MAKDYSAYHARINAIEAIDNLLQTQLDSWTKDYEYYCKLHDEQPDEQWIISELQNYDYKVVLMNEVIKEFEKKY